MANVINLATNFLPKFEEKLNLGELTKDLNKNKYSWDGGNAVEESIEEVELPRMNSYTADDNGYCASFDVVKFGSYEQDGNKDNGSEAIEWYVIAKEDGKSLLLSKYILANTMYNFEMDNGKAVAVDTTWETSWLRQWLNSDFYNNAFLEEEQEHIIQTQLVNSLNDDTGVVIGGNETIDSVFVLSEDEINKYFTPINEKLPFRSNDLSCVPTASAIYNRPQISFVENGKSIPVSKAIDQDIKIFTEQTYNQMLSNHVDNESLIGTIQIPCIVRTPGNKQNKILYYSYASVLNGGYEVNEYIGVRPAIWVDEAALTMYQ